MPNRHVLSLPLALALALSIVQGGPASAETDELGVFTGVAHVGTSFNTSCDASGSAVATGKGLYGALNDRSGTFSLHTSSVLSPRGLSLDICGFMGQHVLVGSGASCSYSRGHGGQGTFSLSDGPYALTNLSWNEHVGSTLVMRADASRSGKSAGSFLSLTQISGGAGCLENKPADGATEVQVVGLFQITHGSIAPDPLPTVDPLPQEPCGRAGTQTYRRTDVVGAVTSEVAVYQGATSVEVCLMVDHSGQRLVDYSVDVPTQVPPPPVSVDPDAPDGDDPSTTPCPVEHYDGDDGLTHAYVRATNGSSSPHVVCLGVESASAARHMRVTVG